MRNIIGYALLLGTFFGMLMIGGCIVTGSLSGPVAALLAMAYAFVGTFGMWLCWRPRKFDMRKAALYYSREAVEAWRKNTPGFAEMATMKPLPTVEGKTIQFFNYIPSHVTEAHVYGDGPTGMKVDGEKDNETRQV